MEPMKKKIKISKKFKSSMEIKDERHVLYLPIHSCTLNMIDLVQTMLKGMKNLKNLKKVMTDHHGDLSALKFATVKIEADLLEFQNKCSEFKKEEVQVFLGQKIREMMRKKLIEKVEINNDKFKKKWVQQRGTELSHCLVRFLWLVLLMIQEKKEKESMIQNVTSFLEQVSVGENHSSVMSCFFAVVRKGVECVDLDSVRDKKKMMMISYQKTESGKLLGLIMNEILSLEVVFCYPSLYPVVFLQSITLDDIVGKINEVNAKLLHEPDVNVMSNQILGSEIEEMWERLELPRTESMAVENGQSGNLLHMKVKLNWLNYLIYGLEKGINGVKNLNKNISLPEDVKVFMAAVTRFENQVESLKLKVRAVAVLMGCSH